MRNKNTMKNKQSGQTLLEALVALTTAVIIISAMTVIVISSLNNAQFSKNQNNATQYAQQGIEILKNQSQSDWPTFAANNGNYCLSKDSTTLTPKGTGCSPTPNVGIFLREVAISQYAVGNIDTSCPPSTAARAKVTVSVGWSDNKCTDSTDVYCHKVKISSCIYKETTTLGP